MKIVVLLALVAAIASTSVALGSSDVVGGYPVDVQNAPWSVLILDQLSPAAVSSCTGSIIDATHILTAAHCLFDQSGSPVLSPNVRVLAGVSDVGALLSTDRPQLRMVVSLRVHPGFHPDDRAGADDVAVLTLADALDLSDPTAHAIALPSAQVHPSDGQAVSLAGFGIKAAGGRIDGTLNGMTATFYGGADCLESREYTANAVLVCGFSGVNSPCSGDSGSALVVTEPTPVAIGITRTGSCSPNTTATFTNLTAPEILRFVEGDDNPPVAPRLTSRPTLERPTETMQVGETVHCTAGSWTGDPSLSYSFLEGTSDNVLRSGSSAYRLGTVDSGRRIICQVAATNAGGTSSAQSATPSQVERPPDLSLPSLGVRAGKVAVLRVTLHDWLRPVGTLTVCASPPARIASRMCRTTPDPAGTRPTVELRLPVRSTAPTGRILVHVTATGGDGRSASSDAVISIRR